MLVEDAEFHCFVPQCTGEAADGRDPSRLSALRCSRPASKPLQDGGKRISTKCLHRRMGENIEIAVLHRLPPRGCPRYRDRCRSSTFCAAISRRRGAGIDIAVPPYLSCRARPLSWMRVRTKPGHRTDTPIFAGRKLQSPAFAHRDDGIFGGGIRLHPGRRIMPAIEAVLTKWPPSPWLLISGSEISVP